MADTVREAIGAAVAPYLVDGQEQDVGIADAVVNAIASLPFPVILKALGHTYTEMVSCHASGELQDERCHECHGFCAQGRPVLVVDNPAPDEAHGGRQRHTRGCPCTPCQREWPTA